MNGSGDLLESFMTCKALGKNENRQVVICPPSLYLERASRPDANIDFGAQDCGAAIEGAYTSEVSAKMLQNAGVKFTLVGHSERRRYQQETNDSCVSKLSTAQLVGVTPIFCIGESRADYQAGITHDVLINQLQSLTVHAVNFSDLVIAYEPIWSIGSGLIPEMDEINAVMSDIRQWLIQAVGFASATRVRLLYGGSVNSKNANKIMKLQPVDGVLVGGASLDLQGFIDIANAA